MKQIFLYRVSMSEKGTFGVLIEDHIPICLTIEKPNINNITYISCIPEGSYICKRVQSPRYGNTFEVTDVPNRSYIRFHKANTVKDIKGCIGVGMMHGELSGEPAVLLSKDGMDKLLYYMKDVNDFALTIKDSWAVI